MSKIPIQKITSDNELTEEYKTVKKHKPKRFNNEEQKDEIKQFKINRRKAKQQQLF